MSSVALHASPTVGVLCACASSYPSRIWKGKKMPGQMGAKNVTVRGVKIVEVRPEENLLLIAGAVPGPAGGYVVIRKAEKN